MAKKSVTAKKTGETFGDLAQRMETIRNEAATGKQAQSVTEPEPETERALAAFSGYDSTVFLAWAAAVADLMASADAQNVDRQTIPECGGLIFSLVKAADELASAERAERKARS